MVKTSPFHHLPPRLRDVIHAQRPRRRSTRPRLVLPSLMRRRQICRKSCQVISHWAGTLCVGEINHGQSFRKKLLALCWVFPLEPLCLCPFWVPMEKPSTVLGKTKLTQIDKPFVQTPVEMSTNKLHESSGSTSHRPLHLQPPTSWPWDGLNSYGLVAYLPSESVNLVCSFFC